jgi:hypothetical protein
MIRQLARRVLRDDSLASEDVASLTRMLAKVQATVNADDLRVEEAEEALEHLSRAGDAAPSDGDAGARKAASRASLLVGGSPGLALDACAGLAKRVVGALEEADTAAAAAAVKALRTFGTALPDDTGADARTTIETALDEVDAHLQRAKTWGLRPVQPRDDQGNRVDGPVTFLLAEFELDIEDLRKLPEQGRLDLSDDKALPFDLGDDGRLVRSKYGNSAPFCDEKGRGSEFQLSRDEATALARRLGVRLPTMSEWVQADRGIPPDKATSVLEELKTRAGGKRPARSDFGRDTLRAMGDESSDGVVGLILGVREWTSDGSLPVGGCTIDPKPAQKSPALLADVGLRLAMDAVPPLIRGIASRRGPDPEPGRGPPQ